MRIHVHWRIVNAVTIYYHHQRIVNSRLIWRVSAMAFVTVDDTDTTYDILRQSKNVVANGDLRSYISAYDSNNNGSSPSSSSSSIGGKFPWDGSTTNYVPHSPATSSLTTPETVKTTATTAPSVTAYSKTSTPTAMFTGTQTNKAAIDNGWFDAYTARVVSFYTDKMIKFLGLVAGQNGQNASDLMNNEHVMNLPNLVGWMKQMPDKSSIVQYLGSDPRAAKLFNTDTFSKIFERFLGVIEQYLMIDTGGAGAAVLDDNKKARLTFYQDEITKIYRFINGQLSSVDFSAFLKWMTLPINLGRVFISDKAMAAITEAYERVKNQNRRAGLKEFALFELMDGPVANSFAMFVAAIIRRINIVSGKSYARFESERAAANRQAANILVTLLGNLYRNEQNQITNRLN